jgi:pimeloyl-ACP methyl ester carboxylesterase
MGALTSTEIETMRNFGVGAATLVAMLTSVVTAGAQQPAALAALTTTPGSARAAAGTTIVLVHGAFADATGWQDLVPLLQKQGYKVVAVQNALSSLAGDVATTKRVIDAQTGPVVAVGHSYGGAVISAAAAGNPSVKALVYIAAFAPDAGERIDAFLEKYPSDLGASVVPDAAGYLYIDVTKYHDVFAADLPRSQTDVMAVAQKPIVGNIFGQSSGAAAWKAIPSWYIVAQQDRSINPDLERFYAKRMNAKTTEIRSSHLPFISHAKQVAALIDEAAAVTRK